MEGEGGPWVRRCIHVPPKGTDAMCIRNDYKVWMYMTGLEGGERDEVQQQWMSGEVPVIVATVSFGMGVDKSNVR